MFFLYPFFKLPTSDNSEAKLLPSKSLVLIISLTLYPAMSAKVGRISEQSTAISDHWPPFMLFFHRKIKGTRIPPSVTLAFPPKNGELSV